MNWSINGFLKGGGGGVVTEGSEKYAAKSGNLSGGYETTLSRIFGKVYCSQQKCVWMWDSCHFLAYVTISRLNAFRVPTLLISDHSIRCHIIWSLLDIKRREQWTEMFVFPAEREVSGEIREWTRKKKRKFWSSLNLNLKSTCHFPSRHDISHFPYRSPATSGLPWHNLRHSNCAAGWMFCFAISIFYACCYLTCFVSG